MSAKPTGRLALREDGLYLMLDRLFAAPAVDVWASLTVADELETWIGRYTGSPRTGAVKFLMSAEDDAEWEYVSILECTAPYRFSAEFGEVEHPKRILFHLVEGTGMTTLTFGRRLRSAAEAATQGPFWDYYLDRLVAARAGRPMPEREPYLPGFKRFYQELVVPKKTA